MAVQSNTPYVFFSLALSAGAFVDFLPLVFQGFSCFCLSETSQFKLVTDFPGYKWDVSPIFAFNLVLFSKYSTGASVVCPSLHFRVANTFLQRRVLQLRKFAFEFESLLRIFYFQNFSTLSLVLIHQLFVGLDLVQKLRVL